MRQWIKLEAEILDDPRVVALVKDHGMRGFGTYVAMRLLVENGGKMTLKSLFPQMTTLSSQRLVTAILSSYDLFHTEGACILSGSRDLAREGARKGARKGARGGVPIDLESNHSEIEKENKENNIKEKNFSLFSEEEVPPVTRRFHKPTVSEIAAYCRERNNGLDAEAFYYYYEARGWLVGKSPMKDWKAAVHLWERKDRHPYDHPARAEASPGMSESDSGTLTYAQIPPDAPPPPSPTAQWDFATESWNEFYG